VADVGEEESLVDSDVCGVLVGGALVGVPLPTNMGIAALLLVILLLFYPLSLLVVIPVTIPSCRLLLEDLGKALDDERHLLVVELGGVDGKST
jgi:hypothetical protein